MRLYLDESVSVVLARVLLQHGIDCLTTRDAGFLGKTDEFQLAFATREQRVLFTHDTRDFLQLAREWSISGQTHGGILLSHQIPLRDLTLRFRSFLLSEKSNDCANKVLWLPAPLEK